MDDVGLESKKIHEFRHTLGTLASKNFNPRMVQAAMRHTSEKSASVYFHPDEEMAAEVRQKIITELSQKSENGEQMTGNICQIIIDNDGLYECPHCKANILILKEKGRNP